MESCNGIIISHFDEIVREPEINHIEFLNLLDIENFISEEISDLLPGVSCQNFQDDNAKSQFFLEDQTELRKAKLL